MGKKSREKGRRGELELSHILDDATKISRAGYVGPDLTWRDRDIEVKRRKDDFKRDYQWLENAQILFKRADRKPWLVTMTLDTLQDLLDEERLIHDPRFMAR